MSISNSIEYQQTLVLICLAILVDNHTKITMLSDAIRHQVSSIIDEVLNDLVSVTSRGSVITTYIRCCKDIANHSSLILEKH